MSYIIIMSKHINMYSYYFIITLIIIMQPYHVYFINRLVR